MVFVYNYVLLYYLIYLYDTYNLEIEDIIKEFENGKASDIQLS